MKINIRMNLVLASIGAIAIAIAIAVSSAVLWSYLDTKSIEGVRRDAEMQTRTAGSLRVFREPNAPLVAVRIRRFRTRQDRFV